MGNQTNPTQKNTGTQQRRQRERKQNQAEPVNKGLHILEIVTMVLGALSAFMAVTLFALLISEMGFWVTPLAGLLSAILLLLATAFYGLTKNFEIAKAKRRFLFWALFAGYVAFLLHSGLAVFALLASL